MVKEQGTKTNFQQRKQPDFQPTNEDIYINIETFIDCFDINEIIEDKFIQEQFLKNTKKD